MIATIDQTIVIVISNNPHEISVTMQFNQAFSGYILVCDGEGVFHTSHIY